MFGANGTRHVGKFAQSKLHGDCEITRPGEKEVGKWENGAKKT